MEHSLMQQRLTSLIQDLAVKKDLSTVPQQRQPSQDLKLPQTISSPTWSKEGMMELASIALPTENSMTKTNNKLFQIMPYIYNTEWVFDDPTVDLDKEAFVNGADLLIYKLVEDIPLATNGFILNFSAMPFDGYSVKLDWLHGDSEGNWYRSEKYQMDGWLCPALFKYFTSPPKELYVGAKSLLENEGVSALNSLEAKALRKLRENRRSRSEVFVNFLAEDNENIDTASAIEDEGTRSKLHVDFFSKPLIPPQKPRQIKQDATETLEMRRKREAALEKLASFKDLLD